ncbi:MAG: tryptophan-rich sensory protein [Chlorobia bacterium]|nr:tryptophan-rich sensory protein [Fimbriimonadaceae bacterium]
MPESKLRPILSFLICQTLCFAVGFIGSQASMMGLQAWYPSLNKPAYNPPGWVFAPVWSILYFMMGIALWQVWRSEPSRARSWGLPLFAFQLILNGLWSWIFFAWHQLPMAFGEIILLDLAILATILAFNKVRSSAAWLLVPYLAWCCFATLLTFSIWKMNPTDGTPKDGEVRIELGPY